MSDPTFGLSITRVDNEPRPAILTDMSIVGLVYTAPDADPAAFPLTASCSSILMTWPCWRRWARRAPARLLLSLSISSLASFRPATIVGVRVEEGADVTETIVNLRGDINSRTGMYALLNAGAELGLTPRLICVPGYTPQSTGIVSGVTVGAAGTGYVVGDAVTATDGGGSGFIAEVSAIGVGGAITAVTITDGGAGYTSPPTLAVTSTAGENAALMATVDTASNAIIAGLPTLLDRLAVAVVDGPSTNQAAAFAWRESIQSERIIPVDSGVKYMNDEGEVVVVPASPAIIGVAVRRDHEFQGRPFHSWANQPI